MTLLFMDGFDTKDASSKWQPGSPTGYSSSTRLGAGFAATFGNEATNLKQFVTAASQLFLGFAYRQDSSNTNTTYAFAQLLGDNGATLHMNLRLNGTSLQLCRGTTVVATVNGLLLPTAWNYLEIGATVDSSVGTCTVKCNNATVISFTGNTRNGGTNTTLDTVYFSGLFAGSGGSTMVDDVYICNSSGSTPTNTFLGDVRVQTLQPAGAGTYTQLTPTGSGSNYLNVSEVPDNTATYNGSSTVGQRDTYAMADLTAGTGTVYAVQQVMSAAKDSAGTANMKNAQLISGSLYYGTSRSLGTTFAVYRNVFETNPATSAAWTATAVNAMEAGAEVA